MKKLIPSDIRGPTLYAGFRDDLRKRVIELKKKRRVSAGPLVTLVFENRATVLFQVEEMCRAESISDPAKIAEEVDVYNALIPDDGQVAATLFVELTDQATLEKSLNDLVGLQDHVWLDVGEANLRATFDPDQFAADKLAAVQYLRFAFTDEAKKALLGDGAIALRIDHPNYMYEAPLPADARAELAADLGLSS